jgi:hypothetical protein
MIDPMDGIGKRQYDEAGHLLQPQDFKAAVVRIAFNEQGDSTVDLLSRFAASFAWSANVSVNDPHTLLRETDEVKETARSLLSYSRTSLVEQLPTTLTNFSIVHAAQRKFCALVEASLAVGVSERMHANRANLLEELKLRAFICGRLYQQLAGELSLVYLAVQECSNAFVEATRSSHMAVSHRELRTELFELRDELLFTDDPKAVQHYLSEFDQRLEKLHKYDYIPLNETVISKLENARAALEVALLLLEAEL